MNILRGIAGAMEEQSKMAESRFMTGDEAGGLVPLFGSAAKKDDPGNGKLNNRNDGAGRNSFAGPIRLSD